MIEYTASGHVIGVGWGDHNLIAYRAARSYTAETLEELLKMIQGAVNDRSIDSGFGFQSVYAAYVDICKKELREIDGRGWTCQEPIGDKIIFAGWLHDRQKERIEDFILAEL